MKAVLLQEHGQYVCDCAAGEVGVLTISGPNVFMGYEGPTHSAGLLIEMGDGQR